MEATPRPWKLIGKTVRGANGEFVGLLMDVSTQSPTDADFAIRAVNSHDRLKNALLQALPYVDHSPIEGAMDVYEIMRDALSEDE